MNELNNKGFNAKFLDFNNGLYNSPGFFYDQTQLETYWLLNGSCTWVHNNEVLINATKYYLKAGEFAQIKIIDATEFDLYGEPA